MALADAALTTGATAIKNEITHMQLHSTNVGGTWATGAIGTRVAVGTLAAVDSDGDITWTNVAFTGLAANAAVGGISYWTASTGGANRGGAALTGDATANSAGEYTVTTVTENLVSV
jgi:hypothetical protein